MILGAYQDNLYDTVLVLHIVLVIVGFGGVVLNGVYGAQAKKRGGAEGLAITETNYFVTSKFAEICIYLVPIAGFALIGLSDSVISFSQTWVWLSLLLYVVALGITHSMIIPSVRRLIVLQRELVGGPPAGGPPPQAAEMQACGQRLALASSINHVLLLVIVVLMVFKWGL